MYLARWRAQNQGLAAAGLHEPQQHLDGRALARPVGAEEAEDFPSPDSQRKAPHSHLVAKYFAQALRLNGKAVGLIQARLPASIGTMTATARRLGKA